MSDCHITRILFVSFPLDPVIQIASELVGHNGHKLRRNEAQSSIFEHANQLSIAEAYDDSYAACYAKSMN
ncbi:hypothetical protein ACTXT7_006667 [Hymenolepis weldensis]